MVPPGQPLGDLHVVERTVTLREQLVDESAVPQS